MVRFLEEHGIGKPPERDDLMDMASECDRLNVKIERLEKERDSARELAAMYLQCMNSRAMERGETVEQVADFCRQEFAENPWLEEEYKRLADEEAKVKSFCHDIPLIGS